MLRLLRLTILSLAICGLSLGCGDNKADNSAEVPDDNVPVPKGKLRDKDKNTTASDPLPPPPLPK